MNPSQSTKTAALTSLILAAGILTASAQTTLTLTHSSPADSHFGLAATAFKKVVEEKSGGTINVVIQRMDNEREALESVQFGSQECAMGSAGPLGNFVAETRVLDVPFLFDSYKHARGVLDSDVGQELLALFPAHGLYGVAWLENGFRNLTTGSKAVHSPDDLRGMKIRTMENQVHMQAWQAAGVLPTPMAFSELPSALQQGTVDGQENPIPVILSNNLDMMQKHLYLTRHVYSPGIFVCNPDFIAGLTDEQKAAVEDGGKAASAANRARVEQDETAGIETLRKRGIEVVEVTDRDAYRKAMASANAGFESQFGADLLKRIRDWKAQ
ncbi:TRAP transporter substrate-binding protein DctP [Pseudorhizobium flavum]|uniref:Tripartite ATP-independent transporter DctP family solute receptor n=1 Tax=Pseudorhizobium flavum TaxID=1335061 RepID=A0A7X0DGT5_9HYPH|nr:TRAP transporter substrate-binding protein DctP [Pseudorhizobium flavum]MBB6182509.1 tripartite ATP-independent transporter DctP family solute receptor [Pseudorhizobium flavum]CAD6619984.1 C4-dicarboxylate ABC transporter substrate-binding protein [Pseudorhizobium flavum]CAD6628286.1 C4-dicarboxylate ABC transporter substrate-binding protein [Rhizobium sp. TCK]